MKYRIVPEQWPGSFKLEREAEKGFLFFWTPRWEHVAGGLDQEGLEKLCEHLKTPIKYLEVPE